VACLMLTITLTVFTWTAFGIWMVFGLLIYFGYSRQRSLLAVPA
jgi:APA family basic amino acid/polyamine antiporter